MPQLIKNIEGNIYDNFTDNIDYIKSISGEIQQEDYINFSSLIAYLQNLTQVEETYKLSDPLIYGLRNELDLPINNLNIDY
jgi:hypothetical protein